MLENQQPSTTVTATVTAISAWTRSLGSSSSTFVSLPSREQWFGFGLDFVLSFDLSVVFIFGLEHLQESSGSCGGKPFHLICIIFCCFIYVICFVCAAPEKVANVQVFLFSPLDDASVNTRNAFVIWNNVAGSINGYNVAIFDSSTGMNLSVHNSMPFKYK